jgi:hypothetical protein
MMQLKPQKLKLHTRPRKPKEKNMKNGNEEEWGEETKNFNFTIKHGYPVHNLNHIIHRKLF